MRRSWRIRSAMVAGVIVLIAYSSAHHDLIHSPGVHRGTRTILIGANTALQPEAYPHADRTPVSIRFSGSLGKGPDGSRTRTRPRHRQRARARLEDLAGKSRNGSCRRNLSVQ